MAAILIILISVIFIIYFKVIFLSGLFAAHFAGISDIQSMYLPFRNFFAQSIRSGQFPLWAPDMFLGFPLHAEGQGGYFYPLNILFAIFPSWVAYNYVFILSVFLTGLFSYLFAKSTGLKKTSALLFSIVFSFSGFFAVHNEHINLLNSATWIPLVFLFTHKINKQKYWIILGLIFAMQFLSGFPQIAYYSMITGFIWLILNTKNIKTIGNFFIAAILSLILAVCQIIPTIELIPYSARAGGIVKSQVNSWGYFFKDILLFINPYIFGNPTLGNYIRKDSIFGENVAFIGIMALLLLIYGIVKNFKNKNIKYFLILSCLIMLFILYFKQIYSFLLILPGMRYFRLPQRMLVFVVLSFAFIAAMGYQELKRFKMIVFLVVLIELVNFSFGYNNVINKKYLSKPKVVEFFKNDANLFRISVNDDKLKAWLYSYYFSTIPELKEKVQLMYRNYLPPNLNMIYNISSINAYSPLVPEIKTDYTNVKYIVSSAELKNEVLIKKINFDGYLPDLRIYRKNKFYSRAFVILDRKSEVVPVNIKQYKTTKIVIDKEKGKGGNLILCDFYYPGWHAYKDGKEEIINKFEGVREIQVSSEKQKIIFTFIPWSFNFGVIISICSIFLILKLFEKIIISAINF